MRHLKIMVIDDNAVNLAMVENELKSKYQIIPMLSGRRAIKYLYKDTVDLILLDIQMPIMNGFEFLKEIRSMENRITTPVIFLTSLHDKQTIIDASQVGVIDFIAKPFNPTDLEKRIDNALKKVGKLPIDPTELYLRMGQTIVDIDEKKYKTAKNNLNEIIGYQINEEIIGRAKLARKRIEEKQYEIAKEIIRKVMQLINMEYDISKEIKARSISTSDMKTSIYKIHNYVIALKTSEAREEIKNLMFYEIPSFVREQLKIIEKFLDEYDDIAAQKIAANLKTKIETFYNTNI